MPNYPYYYPYNQNAYTPENMRQNQYMQYQQMPQVQQPQQSAQPQPINSGIIWVQGEEGAKAYMVAPGNSVLLMDSENSAFYIKSTDNSGMPMPLRIFDYTERNAKVQNNAKFNQENVEYVTRQEFEQLSARINDFMNKNNQAVTAGGENNA